jgi:hypothetical protein
VRLKLIICSPWGFSREVPTPPGNLAYYHSRWQYSPRFINITCMLVGVFVSRRREVWLSTAPTTQCLQPLTLGEECPSKVVKTPQ